MEEEDENSDIAASMGFSSFGGQPNKKRKYNSKTDAVTDAPLRKGSKEHGVGSGSNKMPLGKARPKSIGAQGNRELDGSGKGLAFGATVDGGDAVDDPGYVNDTPPGSPVRVSYNAAMEQGISQAQASEGTDRDISNRASVPTKPLAVEDKRSQGLPPKPLSSMSIPSSLPPKPPVPTWSSGAGASEASVGRVGGSDNGLRQLRKGVKNEKGDIGYYDPSFVEDPWKELLEKSVGMDKG